MQRHEEIETVVIGAGQAGLSVGYHLSRRGASFVILEANPHIGDTWRRRWDSLRLFTPARFCGLAGLPFPASPNAFPTKDDMADYLEAYAARFALPVRTGVTVDRVTRWDGGFLVTAGELVIHAVHVVVAMASYQKPWTPPFAAELDPAIVQLHSISIEDRVNCRVEGNAARGGSWRPRRGPTSSVSIFSTRCRPR